MGSTQLFAPTPNCRLLKSSFSSLLASFAEHYAFSLLKTPPTAIKQKRLSFSTMLIAIYYTELVKQFLEFPLGNL